MKSWHFSKFVHFKILTNTDMWGRVSSSPSGLWPIFSQDFSSLLFPHIKPLWHLPDLAFLDLSLLPRVLSKFCCTLETERQGQQRKQGFSRDFCKKRAQTNRLCKCQDQGKTKRPGKFSKQKENDNGDRRIWNNMLFQSSKSNLTKHKSHAVELVCADLCNPMHAGLEWIALSLEIQFKKNILRIKSIFIDFICCLPLSLEPSTRQILRIHY